MNPPHSTDCYERTSQSSRHVGTAGNFATLLVILDARRLRNNCTPFLISLSVCDLLMTLVVLPLIGANAVSGRILVPFPVCKYFSIVFHILMREFPHSI